MAKFGTPDPNLEPERPTIPMDEREPATRGAASRPEFSGRASFTSVPQISEAAQLARIELETKQWQAQLDKESEHWMKAMWRPAMGWLYMAMCAFDFILFPLITIILPIIQHNIGINMPYNEWKSLTLSNGGLIHLAFGAILGVAAYTRGQEKIAGKA